ncbi:hypothetical protein D1872_314880 [compost metagenome]
MSHLNLYFSTILLYHSNRVLDSVVSLFSQPLEAPPDSWRDHYPVLYQASLRYGSY